MTLQSLTVLGSLLGLISCTTLTPVEMPPATLQAKIVAEDILQPGKRAKIVTSDGRMQRVRIKRVDGTAGIVETDGEPVQIANIIAVETHEFSLGKTALLAAGSYTVLALIALAVGPALLL